MILFFYQLIEVVLGILLLPIFWAKGFLAGHAWQERMGNYDVASAGKTVWFHAASVGELKVLATLISALRSRGTDILPLVTVITPSARQLAQKIGLGVACFYAPFDLAPVVGRVLRRTKPVLLVLAETEIWPVLITQTAKFGARVVIINGRLTCKSLRYYRLLRPLFRHVVGHIDLVMAQTREDAERFIAIGVPRHKVSVCGNMKFDQLSSPVEMALPNDLARFFDRTDDFVFVGASVRRKEIKYLLDGLIRAREHPISLVTVIAPRHMKDLPAMERHLRRQRFDYIRRSKLEEAFAQGKLPSVLLLDSMGELKSIYPRAHLAFVGASLVPIGGHDPLEPAASGCAVCFGPFMDNSRPFASGLIAAGGARQINDAYQLSELIVELASNRDACEKMRRAAKEYIVANGGVSQRVVDGLTEYL